MWVEEKGGFSKKENVSKKCIMKGIHPYRLLSGISGTPWFKGVPQVLAQPG
jgi:hypothetical protein